MGSVTEYKVQPGDTWLEASQNPDGRFCWNGGGGGCVKRPQANRHIEDTIIDSKIKDILEIVR